MNAHARAHVSNLSRNTQATLEVSQAGDATVSIRAEAGERLAITVDAVSLPNDSSTVIWRPAIAFSEGELVVTFHYYHYIEHWCDAEGDATIRLELYADRT